MSPGRGQPYGHGDHLVGRKRRASPSYEDYPNDGEEAQSDSQRREQYERGPFPPYGAYDMASTLSARQYHTSGSGGPSYAQYGDYKREGDADGERRRSASPTRRGEYDRERPVNRGGSPTYRPPSSPPPKTPRFPTPPPRQTEPTEAYLLASIEPSWRLEDPTESRKLVILDLNGSLLLRSEHHRNKGRPDPYAASSKLRPLRTVHPRPYLSVFRSYVLHAETKKWLDTMVWSSAQPHSVQDMVGKCFLERQKELKAVWARDTLGLTPDEYHKKSQTLKDLAKPWQKISAVGAGATGDDTENVQMHSANSTLLVDDSELKAALQPWNHLCIKEYVQETRARDLVVAQFEAARRRALATRQAFEAEQKREEDRHAREDEERKEEERKLQEAVDNPNVTKLVREVVMIDGRVIGEEQVVKKVVRELVIVDGEMVDEQAAMGEESFQATTAEGGEKQMSRQHKKRNLKRHAKKEAIRKAKEDVLLNKFADAEVEEGEIGTEDQVLAQEKEEARLKSLEEKMKYDETLLAVIGILDHIKYEGNVAGWLRAGGLLDVESKSEVVAQSPPALPSPTKRRRIQETPEPETDDENVPRSSSAPPPPSSSQIIGSPSSPRPSSPIPENSGDREQQASTGLPFASSYDGKGQDMARSTTLWFERPKVLAYWANRGREAAADLGISVESGVGPPGQ